MAKKKKTLEDIFNDDLDGLLDSKAKTSNAQSEEERLIASFEEINDFYKKNKREPQEGNISESSLCFRLDGIRNQPEKVNVLRKYDIYDLLVNSASKDYTKEEASVPIVAEPDFFKEEDIEEIPVEINSIDDIFNNDEFGILENAEDSIFNLKHVPEKKTTMPDYIASRKRCDDFEKFEPLFIQCHQDIRNEQRKVLPFSKEQQIDQGHFFVLKGVLLYVAEVGKRKNKKGKFNARLRCIFENGTESDMLLRSLAAELYKDGRRVTEHDEKLLDNFKNITEADKQTGYIYVLKSKSKDSEIVAIKNLFKIGYSSTPVEERIKNAEKEPTYLMAPVKIVTTYKCYNMEPKKLEQLLHRFFGKACLNVDVFDEAGQRYTPREWFIAPFEVIEQAIHFMLSGEIVDLQYDVEKGEIVGR